MNRDFIILSCFCSFWG